MRGVSKLGVIAVVVARLFAFTWKICRLIFPDHRAYASVTCIIGSTCEKGRGRATLSGRGNTHAVRE